MKGQFLAGGLVTGIASMSIGTVLGYSAILLPQLEEEGIMEAKSERASWIAGLSTLGAMGAAMFVGQLQTKFGRRGGIMGLSIPLAIGWLIIGFSQGNFAALCVGRVFTGVGIMSSVTQVYLVEVADVKWRGAFGASGALSVSAGITIIYGLGAGFHWTTVAFVGCAIAVSAFTVMIWLPETPNWLFTNGQEEAAKNSLIWLRGATHNPTSINEEFNQLAARLNKKPLPTVSSETKIAPSPPPQTLSQTEDQLQQDNSEDQHQNGGKLFASRKYQKVDQEFSPDDMPTIQQFSEASSSRPGSVIVKAENGALISFKTHEDAIFKADNASNEAKTESQNHNPTKNPSTLDLVKKIFKKRSYYKPFLILIGTFSLMQATGTFAVIFYAVNVFSDILKDPSESSETKEKDRLTPYYAAILVGLIRLAGTVLGTALIKRFPRKTLMVSSAIMMALFMTTLGLNEFYLERVGIKDAVKAISNATGDEETFANATTEAMTSHEAKLQTLRYLSALQIILYMLAFGIGVGTVPWLLLGELCPTEIKGFSASLTTLVAYLVIFLVVKCFPIAVSAFGIPSTYWIFAGLSGIMAIFTANFIPETKGKSLAEIEAIFEDRKDSIIPLTENKKTNAQ